MMASSDGQRQPGRQLVLDLAREPSFAPDEFLVSDSNETAYVTLQDWPAWPDRALLLIGPAGSGKSHLAAMWAVAAGGRFIPPGEIADTAFRRCTDAAAVLEDCDRLPWAEAAFFHLLNAVRDGGGWLLMTARVAPTSWGIKTPDLLSRLRLAPSVFIGHPDATLMKAVVVKLFSDRQIAIDEEVVSYATRHCEQSLDAISRFVAAVDGEALAAGRRITRQLAAQTLAKLDAEGPALGD